VARVLLVLCLFDEVERMAIRILCLREDELLSVYLLSSNLSQGKFV